MSLGVKRLPAAPPRPASDSLPGVCVSRAWRGLHRRCGETTGSGRLDLHDRPRRGKPPLPLLDAFVLPYMQKDVGSRRNAPAFHAALRSPTKQPAVPEPPGHENANHHAPRGPEDALGAVEVASGLFFQSLALLLVLPQAPPPLPPGRPAVPSRRPSPITLPKCFLRAPSSTAAMSARGWPPPAAPGGRRSAKR